MGRGGKKDRRDGRGGGRGEIKLSRGAFSSPSCLKEGLGSITRVKKGDRTPISA